MINIVNNGKDYSFQVFKILFDFYLFGKKIEKFKHRINAKERIIFHEFGVDRKFEKEI